MVIPVTTGIQGDANFDGIVTIVDAILASNWLLYGVVPPSIRTVDLNKNGIFDPDDILLIFQLGIWGNSSVVDNEAEFVESSNGEDKSAEGTINIYQQINNNITSVSIDFTGDLGIASRFGGSLNYNFEAFSLSGVVLKNSMSGISGFADIGGKVNVLNYFQGFDGKIAVLTFQRIGKGNLELSLIPLVADNFLQFGEKVKVNFAAPTGVIVENILPKDFSLSQNYPNPFNPSTKISFNLPQSVKATLKVYDMLGREVATLADGELSAGNHEVVFDASDLPSGAYIGRLQAGNFIGTKKMIFMK